MCRCMSSQMQLFDILVDYTMHTHCINVFLKINGNVIRIEHTIMHRVRWILGQAVCALRAWFSLCGRGDSLQWSFDI